MEMDSFRQLAQKALDFGFVIIEQLNVKSENGLYHGELNQYRSLDEIDFAVQKVQYYFHLKEAGEIVVSDNGFIDDYRSPVVQAGYSRIYEYSISRGRIWVSSGYFDDAEKFISRLDILDKKYSALSRYVKKLAPYTEIPSKFINGLPYVSKEYITPYLLNLITTTQYECIQV